MLAGNIATYCHTTADAGVRLNFEQRQHGTVTMLAKTIELGR
jgi:hypothetical protein